MDVQQIRLLDVFVVAPILIGAATFKSLPNYMRVALLMIGVLTLVYNGSNYLEER